MKTLYLRNVPDDVAERLEELARREGMSVSAFAVRELSTASRRADNAALLRDLPHHDLAVGAVVAELDRARADR